jgi:argininosuccinate lyase
MARLDDLDEALCDTITILGERAEEHAETLLAGTTHMQPALPITLGQYLLSCAAAIVRDLGRVRDARKRTALCPLGAGAMAGSGFPVDRDALAEAMGFSGVLPNSVDAIADRDFCIEIANACATLLVHLSRYADQMIVWANPAFGYIRFADQWSTGSSMMPQKRNPDAMELVRGKVARAIGASVTLQNMLKGLPLSYAKDLQEDKEPLFDTLDQTLLTLRVFAQAVKSATFNEDRMLAVLTSDMLATDLADHLARAGVPFRQAHERVGALVSDLEASQRDLLSVSKEETLERFPELGPEPPELSFKQGVAMRLVKGGTAPEKVREQIANLPKLIAEA